MYNKQVNLPNIGMSPQDYLDMSVINIDTPQISSPVDNILVAGSYRLTAKKFQVYTFSVTFRDTVGMPLKQYFTKVWMKQQTEYFDDIKTTIKLSASGKNIFSSDDCLIDSISQSQFDNSNTQAAEFTVSFVSPFYTDSNIKKFGAYSAN